MPGTTVEKFVVSGDYAKNLFEEKLNSLQADIARVQNGLAKTQQQVDQKREESDRLDKEIAKRKDRLNELTDKALNGEQALAEHKTKTMKLLADREDTANVRVEAAVSAEKKADRRNAEANNRFSAAKGAKSDLLDETDHLIEQLQTARKQIDSNLEAIQ